MMQFDEKYFCDNIYRQKYINLIESNIDTHYEKFKSARHHIIPKSYFKLKDIPIDNSKSNIVILPHSQHLLAHYYLCHFIIDSELLYKMQCAFLSMSNELSCNALQLENYESIMYNCLKERSDRYKNKKQKPRTEEQKLAAKLRCKGQHKGYIWICDKEKLTQHYINPKDIDKYPGFVRGRLPYNLESRKHMQEGQKTQAAKEARIKGHTTRLRNIEERKNAGIINLRDAGLKSVICIDLNLKFSSIKEAKHWLGRGDIGACCRHRQKKAGNHFWAFSDDVEWIEKLKVEINQFTEKKKIQIQRKTKSGSHIRCLETEMEFNSVTSAKKWLAEQNKCGDIYHALIDPSATAGNYHWEYVS